MNRPGISVAVAVVAGALAVFLLPPPWLGPLSAVAAVCFGIFALIVRLDTKTEPPSNPVAGVVLSVLNLPEQPLAEVKEGWALSIFFASAAFLVSLGLTVMALANA